MASRKDKQKLTAKPKLTAKLKKFKPRKLQRLQRRLGRKIGDYGIKNMSVKDTVKLLMRKFGKKAPDVVSKILNDSKHKRKRRHRKEKDNENRISTSSAVENDDKQDIGVIHPSTVIHAGGAPTENRHPNGNAITAADKSNLINPTISACTVHGNLIIKSNLIVKDPGSNLIVPNDHHTNMENILRIRDKIKERQKNTCANILEGIANDRKSSLNKVYTELYIVACDFTSINEEHEVWHAETAHLKDASKSSVIKCQDIFKPDEDVTIRTVVTKGIAGIGKSIAVQKLNLDWANGKANQDLDFVFLLSFRKLNLIKDLCSLHKLLEVFYPELKEINMIMYDEHKILLILDGLDESQLQLDFDTSRLNLTSVSESATLVILLMNLIAGNLLPNALIWITSRPVASKQIPLDFVNRVTEIRGFNDAQKDEYFKKQICDPEMARDIISYITGARSLHIMCHIPLFSWMAVTVLQDILSRANKDDPKPRSLPTTITDMYMHYIRIQTNISFQKHRPTQAGGTQCNLMSNKDIIFKLGKLAYDHLERQTVLFTEEDLFHCGIHVMEAASCPGLITELKELEFGLYPRKLYCFIHLSVQEFFAALYAFHEFDNNKVDSLKALLRKNRGNSMIDFLKGAIDSALDSKNGHLDLFTRFLVGCSHKSSWNILQGILPGKNSSSECHKKLITYIKNLRRKDLSPERCINLIHCLLQLKDPSFLQENNHRASSDTPLTPFQCSLLAYKFIISEKPQEFDFRNNKTSEEGFNRLAPALLSCSTALLNFCHISPLQCATVASVLRSELSRLTVLDLGHNNLGDAGVKRLCDGLGHHNCKVETLNLSHNNVGNQGVKELCRVLTPPVLKLQTLDLSCNDFGDSGLELLAFALYDGFSLQVLRLSGCSITLPEDVKSVLDIALRSCPSQMKVLDLSYNPIREADVGFLLDLNLILDHGAESSNKQGLDKYACELTLDPNTVNSFLLLSEEDRKVTRQRTKEPYPNTEDRFDVCNQVLSNQSLCKRHYLEVECLHDVHVGMAYKRIKRKGVSNYVRLGHNAESWALFTSHSKSHAQHNDILHSLHIPEIKAGVPYRVGVFLDWPAGILAFYMVSNGIMVPLHAFYSTFTEPLYFAIGLNSPTATVSL